MVEDGKEDIEQPIGEIETGTRRIWADVLNKNPAQLTRNVSFFPLSGDSIAAMRVAARCRQESIGFR